MRKIHYTQALDWSSLTDCLRFQVLLANRGSGKDPAVSVTVDLSELPGGLTATGEYTVRDLWKHAEAAGALSGGKLTMKAAAQGSVFYRVEPKK